MYTGVIMADTPSSPLKDKNYNLVWAVHESLENAWRLQSYIEDAQSQGDDELVQWFTQLQESQQRAGTEGKRLLAQRLQAENG